ADAAKATAAGADLRLQHRADPVAEGEVGIADDTGRHPGGAIAAALAHRGDAGDELDLADRPHLFRPVGAVHRVALLEHAGVEVVAGARVGEILVEQIAVAAPVPEEVVRVDDRQLRLDRRLRRLPRLQSLVRRDYAPERPGSAFGGHVPLPGHTTSLRTTGGTRRFAPRD